MLKGLGDIGNLLKMQKDLKNIQKKISTTKMEGSGAGGRVNAIMTGDYTLQAIKIDPALLEKTGAPELERMILMAVNDAVKKIKDFSASEMSSLTGGLDIPGLSSFLK